jgi:hypothetical protein
MTDREWFGCLPRRDPMSILFACVYASDEYWCELREDEEHRLVAYVFKNRRPIRARAATSRSAAISWAIAEHDAIARRTVITPNVDPHVGATRFESNRSFTL